MKREINFRAKESSGKWVYGGIVWLDGDKPRQWFISYTYDSEDKKPRVRYIKVNRNTIGQYTGLKDKNDKKIYEGDIVNAEQFVFVGYKDSGIPDSPNEIMDDVIGAVEFKDGSFQVGGDIEIPLFSLDFENVEVIGNIYETPNPSYSLKSNPMTRIYYERPISELPKVKAKYYFIRKNGEVMQYDFDPKNDFNDNFKNAHSHWLEPSTLEEFVRQAIIVNKAEPVKISEEIKEKIEQEAENRFPTKYCEFDLQTVRLKRKSDFKDGAEYALTLEPAPSGIGEGSSIEDVIEIYKRERQNPTLQNFNVWCSMRGYKLFPPSAQSNQTDK